MLHLHAQCRDAPFWLATVELFELVPGSTAYLPGPHRRQRPSPVALTDGPLPARCDKKGDSRCFHAPLCDTPLYMSKASIPPILAIRLPPMDRVALECAARADDRPVSTLARKIIVEWLRVQKVAEVSK